MSVGISGGSLYGGARTQRIGKVNIPARGESDFYTGESGFTKSYRVGGSAYSSRERGDFASKGKRKVGEIRREASNRRRFIKHRKGLLMSLVVLLITFLIVTLIYRLIFVVNSISVEGNSRYTAEEVLDASSISEGVNLFSFRASTVKKSITFNCPYISDVEIDRNVPNSVTFNVTEDVPAYCVNIYGETMLLSEGLRVLESIPEGGEIPDGVVKLKLPTVTYSVSGRVIQLAETKYDKSIREVLSGARDSALADKLTSIDLRDPYRITMVCESRIKLVLGDSDNTYMKLATAAAVMQDDMFKTENKIKVDLTLDGKTGVMIDNMMELE